MPKLHLLTSPAPLLSESKILFVNFVGKKLIFTQFIEHKIALKLFESHLFFITANTELGGDSKS